jgi:hypothetical protein
MGLAIDRSGSITLIEAIASRTFALLAIRSIVLSRGENQSGTVTISDPARVPIAL